jgi:hypothetical protein
VIRHKDRDILVESITHEKAAEKEKTMREKMTSKAKLGFLCEGIQRGIRLYMGMR